MKVRPCYLILLLVPFCTRGQAMNDTAMYTDIYTGVINGVRTSLTLRHCRYCDMGTFKLSQKSTDVESDITGEWTVLKGDAVNENAVVVDLYLKNKDYYYLRKNKATLQQLDDSLRVIRPGEKYILRRL